MIKLKSLLNEESPEYYYDKMASSLYSEGFDDRVSQKIEERIKEMERVIFRKIRYNIDENIGDMSDVKRHINHIGELIMRVKKPFDQYTYDNSIKGHTLPSYIKMYVDDRHSEYKIGDGNYNIYDRLGSSIKNIIEQSGKSMDQLLYDFIEWYEETQI